MGVVLNRKGYSHARALISAGHVDRKDAWSFTAADGNAMLGKDGQCWDCFASFHLGEDTSVGNNQSKERFKYPFGKDGEIYRAGVIAAKQRAAEMGEADILSAATELLRSIDMMGSGSMMGAEGDGVIEGDFNDKINLLAAVTKKGSDGSVWDVTIIKSGFAPSLPPVFISEEAIRSSVASFRNARVYANENADYFGHKTQRAKKGIREIVGILKNPYVQGDEMRASFHIKPSAQWLKDDLQYFAEQNALDTYQLSIDSGFVQRGVVFADAMKKDVPNVVAITPGDVDIVPNGAAGGKFNRLVASQNHNHNFLGDTKMKQKLLSLFMLFYPTFLAGAGVTDLIGVNENELYTNLLQAGKGFLPTSLPDGINVKATEGDIDGVVKLYREKFVATVQAATPAAPNSDGNAGRITQIANDMKSMQLQLCAASLSGTLATSKLPEETQKIIAARWNGKLFTQTELEDDIKYVRTVMAGFTQRPVDDGSRGGARITLDQVDKFQAAMDGLVLTSGERMNPLRAGTPEYEAAIGSKELAKVEAFRSIKEAYILATGDKEVTGRIGRRMLASIDTAQFDVIVGNALNKALVADYNKMDMIADVRKVANMVDLNSIQEQKRIRYGGYTDAPTVAEGGPYLGADSPDDEEAVYTPVKKGYTEDITIETIKKDDVGAVNKVPSRIARATSRTMYKAVFQLLNPHVNSAIYDAKALYHADHSNTATTALGADGVALFAAVKRMLSQAEAGSSEVIGIRPGYLLHPVSLAQIADQLTRGAYGVYNNQPTYLQALGIQPLLVPFWESADSTDWALTPRREDGVPVEVGFVDGKQTPEIFVSDLANVGSMFTNDKITYKIRFWYGMAVIDYRFADGSIVA